MGVKYDFSGYATKNDLRCSDGRTIRKNAFKDCDGKQVPLVWQHQHNEVRNVLGHALLENREDGVYCYGTFNNSEEGQDAKLRVQNGDITHMSIYANQLTQDHGNVLHGVIREVSLVLAGANPGALIDYPILAHSGEEIEDEAIIYLPDEEAISLYHGDEEGQIPEAKDEDEVKHADKEDEMADEKKVSQEEEKGEEKKETVKDIFDTLNEKQKKVVYYMIGQAIQDAKKGGSDKEDEEDKEDEGEDMKHNVFENEMDYGPVLSHADMETIFRDAKKMGSLKDAVAYHQEEGVLAHAMMPINTSDGVYELPSQDTASQTYGIRDMNMLFPEYKNLNNPPEWIKRDTSWVSVVMAGVHHTPFSRIKSSYANITEDDARARGYIKGRQKKEEVFTLLKRTTDPQTVYKKQKLDKDDITDITDFDVVAWIKSEMRIMLDEELARAYLIGDGRANDSDDKIKEDHIRPIAKDADLFNIKINLEFAANTDSDVKAKKFIDEVIRNRKYYKGSGNPKLFTTADMLTEMLLLEDGIGHKLYKSTQELATALRVSDIVEVEVMEGQKIDGKDLVGIIVNLADYNVGADKGGAVEMFDDFDIDYNQYKYLIETRCSGALIKPFSAMTVTMSTQA